MPPTGTLGSKGWRRVHRPLLAQAEPLALPGSDPLSLERVVRTVLDRLAGARSAFLLAGMLVRRTANRERLRALLDASGLPFTTMFMGKSVIDEHHSGYIGIYDGALMNEEVRAFVEGADLVLNVGALMTDFNTGAFFDPTTLSLQRPGPSRWVSALPAWRYTELPSAFGCDNWTAQRVTTNAELDAALSAASESKGGVYVEIVTDTYAAPPLARKLGGAVQTLYK